MSSDPPYVRRGGMQVYPQPVVATGMELYGFVAEADLSRLNHTLDHDLNQPSGGTVKYEALSPYVLLSFAHLPRLVSQDPQPDEECWISESEVAVWIFAADTRRDQPVLYNPYILVDHPWALSAGREIYGYPKEWAWIAMPENRRKASRLLCETLVVESYGPDAPVVRQPLFELEATGRGILGEIWDGVLIAARELANWLSGRVPLTVPTLEHLFEQILRGHQVQAAFLKQFRDATDGRQACYQAIVEAPGTATRLEGIHTLGEYELTVHSYASHPVSEDLGLKSGTHCPGFWVKMDFVIGNGKLIADS